MPCWSESVIGGGSSEFYDPGSLKAATGALKPWRPPPLAHFRFAGAGDRGHIFIRRAIHALTSSLSNRTVWPLGITSSVLLEPSLTASLNVVAYTDQPNSIRATAALGIVTARHRLKLPLIIAPPEKSPRL